MDFDKLNAKDPKRKYGFTKELLKIGATNPKLLYEYFEHYDNMIASENNIIRWTAIDIIGYLSGVDKDDKTDQKLKELIKLLHGGHLITCNHAIFALGLMARNKPTYQAKILKELLAISKDTFDTNECKAIATGKVLDTLKDFLSETKNNKTAFKFIKDATNSQRNSTKKKAERLLRKIEKADKT